MRSAPSGAEVGYLPAAHGSAIFTRGETQALATVTLGTKLDEKVKDEVLVLGHRKQFVLHYNFRPSPPARQRPHAVSRAAKSDTDTSHGAPLKPMIPLGRGRTPTPFASCRTSSNQRFLVDGNRLRRNPRLMDAGVKIKKPVSGIAMGLISDSATGKWAVLSDILGDEDHLGDMDFKVTGTRTVSPPRRWISRSTDFHTRSSPQRWSRHARGVCTSSARSPSALPSRGRTTSPCVPRIVQITIPQGI